MKEETKRKLMKYSTVMGSILLLLPNGSFWYWGSMSVYSMSYFVSALGSTSNVDTPWIVSSLIVFESLGIMLSGTVAHRFGCRSSILIGVFITNISIFSSYFSNQHSVMALAFSMGVGLGMGVGLVNGSALQMVMGWADDDVGLLTALIQSSYAIGGVIINQLVTLYTNPANLLPELKYGLLKYFTQKSVLDKVPFMYLVLGGFATTVHVLGFSMLRERPKDVNAPIQKEMYDETETSHEKEGYIQGKECAMVDGGLKDSDNTSLGQSPTDIHSTTLRESEIRSKDFTPKEMLKSPSFYVLWISFFLGNVPFVLLVNYYKLYGQLYIKDDHFLTNLGTTFVFINIFISILWGRMMDKFGVKNCLIAFMTGLIMVTAWYFFTPMASKWLYFVATILMGSLVGPIYCCFTAATVLMYGKANLSTNFGIVMTSSMTFNLLAPSLLHVVLTRLGWFYLFGGGACCNLISVTLIVLFIPRV